MLLVFLFEGKLLNLRLLLATSNLIDVAGIWLGRPKASDTPCPKKPARWNKKDLLKEVVLLVVVIASGSWLCAYSVPQAERLPVLSLLIAMGDLWLTPLVQAGDYVWSNKQTSRTICIHLAIYAFVTIMCITG